jgi:hypothetical protein
VLRLVSYAYMPSPLPRQVQWSLFARASPLSAAFPCVTVRSAPAITFSGPAQRSLMLRPARSPSHQRDPLHRKLRRLGYPRRRFDCYRVERTSSRAGVSPAEVQRLSRRTVTPVIIGHVGRAHPNSMVRLAYVSRQRSQWSLDSVTNASVKSPVG